MDWEKFATLWGPAVPMFAVFVFYLHRLIFRTVPRGFRSLRLSILEVGRRADVHHAEAMDILRRLEGRKKGSPAPRRAQSDP